MGGKSNKASDRSPLLLTADGVARVLAISKRSLWRLLSAGRIIRPIKLGGSVRWREEELREWIARGCPAVSDDGGC